MECDSIAGPHEQRWFGAKVRAIRRIYRRELYRRLTAALRRGRRLSCSGVSLSYIYKALIRRRRTGQVIASPRRGHRPRKLSPVQEVALAAHIEAYPDLTLAALQTWLLAEHGVRLSNGAMWSAVARREGRRPGLVLEAACWVRARRRFFVLADLAASAQRKAQGKTPAVISPIALEAVRRIDALFDIERQINGHSADHRRAVREELSAPLAAELETWMRQERARLSCHNDVAQAMDYMLKRWPAFTRFLNDGRICLSNNAAERALRGIALGRRAWLFAGSDRGGDRAAFMYSLIVTAKMNDIDPQAWLADVLRRIADHPASRLHELLPWN